MLFDVINHISENHAQIDNNKKLQMKPLALTTLLL